jgi:hypothetical protein
VDASFNFADFVSDYLAEEFANVVKLEFLMWVIAIVWIAFPAQAYAGELPTSGALQMQHASASLVMVHSAIRRVSHGRAASPCSPQRNGRAT